jgi:RNA recognition motif-containing protein
VRGLQSNKSKGFGFVSLLDPMEFAQAMREMNGKYIGNRPCKLKKSSWEDREAAVKGKGIKGGKSKRHIYHLT